LGSDSPTDLANSLWKRKQKNLDGSNITVISPSQWLAEQARKSSLFGEMQIEVIPNCLDMDLFYPRTRSGGIQHFDLKKNKHYVLFGSAYETSRKGGDLFLQALEQLDKRSDVSVLTFGNTDSRDQKFPVPVYHLGNLSEDELRLVYSTADLTVVPSREDNLPNIAVESIASGTPCVAFDVGGLSDIVAHRKNGYLAKPFDTSDLADGINWILNNPNRLNRVSKYSRKKAQETYSTDRISDKYINLYNNIINGN
jgi:glycosyltransferase involved in cell wall biosynthesis